MNSAIALPVESQEWYQALVEECRAIVVEAEFTARWALVEGYHTLGMRIVSDGHFEKYAKGNESFLTDLSRNLGLSYRTLYRAVEFARKFPNLEALPEGKNTSWNQVVTKYLPGPKVPEVPLPPGVYAVVCADPPWKYDFSRSESREIENQYSTMELEDICAKPVPGICAENCVLFLWATSPKLPEAMAVISAWGFTYKTCMVWAKDKIGMGYYARQKHELLLIATRGTPNVPEPQDRPESVICAPRVGHSVKPDRFYKIIERMYPTSKRVELFARKQREGWDNWGAEW